MLTRLAKVVAACLLRQPKPPQPIPSSCNIIIHRRPVTRSQTQKGLCADKLHVQNTKVLKVSVRRIKSHVRGRSSSLIHAISNQLAQVATKPSDLDRKLRAKFIKEDGLCAYCRTSKACSQDHFCPLVKNRMPTVFCNDFWNMIPCCHACNSSKRNLSVLEWLDSDVGKNPSRLLRKQRRLKERRRWQAYARLFHSRCRRKQIDKEWWDTVLQKIQDFLEMLDTDVVTYFNTQIISSPN